MAAILYCEDDRDQRVSLLDFLELSILEGYKIIPTASIEEAVSAYGQVKNEKLVLISDGILNGRYAWDLLEELRTRGFDGKSIFYGQEPKFLPLAAQSIFEKKMGLFNKVIFKDPENLDLLVQTALEYLKETS